MANTALNVARAKRGTLQTLAIEVCAQMGLAVGGNGSPGDDLAGLGMTSTLELKTRSELSLREAAVGKYCTIGTKPDAAMPRV